MTLRWVLICTHCQAASDPVVFPAYSLGLTWGEFIEKHENGSVQSHPIVLASYEERAE